MLDIRRYKPISSQLPSTIKSLRKAPWSPCLDEDEADDDDDGDDHVDDDVVDVVVEDDDKDGVSDVNL